MILRKESSEVKNFETLNLISEQVHLKSNFKNVISAPYISTGASDSRFFTDLSENIFRFAPFICSNEQLNTIHSKDENIDINSLIPAVDFYKELVKKA